MVQLPSEREVGSQPVPQITQGKGDSASLQPEWVFQNCTFCPKQPGLMPVPEERHIWLLGCHYITLSHLPMLGKYRCCWFVWLRAFSLQLCSLPFPHSSVPSPPGCWGNVFRAPGTVFSSHCSSAVILMLLILIALHLHTPTVFLWWVLMGSDYHQWENQPFFPTFATFWL